jgi:hypothetical protein
MCNQEASTSQQNSGNVRKFAKDLEKTISSSSPKEKDVSSKEPLLLYGLPDDSFKGPEKSAYISFCVLEPCITIERQGENFHIAARFNIETSILRYNSRKK